MKTILISTNSTRLDLFSRVITVFNIDILEDEEDITVPEKASDFCWHALTDIDTQESAALNSMHTCACACCNLQGRDINNA